MSTVEPETVSSWYEPPIEAQQRQAPSFGEHLKVAALLDPVSQQLSALREEMKELRSVRSEADTGIGPLRQELETFRTFMGYMLADRASNRLASVPKDVIAYHEVLVTA